MPEYLFRAEAVNLTPTVYDTSDISTIRGGGFYLLDKIHSLSKEKRFSELMTEGASSAVFRTETDDPECIRQRMLSFLYGSPADMSVNESAPAMKEMMFLVAYVENGSDETFANTMAALQGKIRLQQYQSSSVRILKDSLEPRVPSESPEKKDYDYLNRTLPAHRYIGGKNINVSNFTFFRRNEGIRLRKKLYEELLKEKLDCDFTDDLEDLCDDPSQGNLNGKIAFIYIDGNKFGKLQRDFTPPDFQRFDRTLTEFKKRFLKKVLTISDDNSAFNYTKNGKRQIRFETLLWGGDEIKLVVPAWLGWTIAMEFFECVRSDDMLMAMPRGNKDLTYAMGLVFAHHKNPIRNIDKIAKDLTDTVKMGLSDALGERDEPQYRHELGNRMHVAVLESLETLPSDFDTFALSRYFPSTKSGLSRKAADENLLALSFTPSDMKNMADFAGMLNKGISRSKLYEIAHTWAAGDLEAHASALQRALDVSESDPQTKASVVKGMNRNIGVEFEKDKVKSVVLSKGFRWLQIAELWDYLIWKEK